MALPSLLFSLLLLGQSPAAVYRVGNGVKPPTPVYSVHPELTELARKAEWEGTVKASVVVDSNGDVIEAKILKSVGMGMDEAFLQAVKKWKFKPGTKEGQPVAVFAQIETTFRPFVEIEDVDEFLKSAEAQTPFGQRRLALAYLAGRTTERDPDEALYYFRRAAEGGDRISERRLGDMLWHGFDTDVDKPAGAEWYRRAAEHGDMTAQTAFAKIYIDGEGFIRDYVKAYMWLTIAARTESAEAIRLRDELAAKMSRAEIEQAKELAANWRRQ